jgi:rRNA maturation RNase YbeY
MAVYVRARLKGAKIRRSRFVRFSEQVLAAAGESASELSVELVGDRRMRTLNRRYRKKDRTTDVLAFAMREAANPCPTLLGDVVISIPTAVKQAKAAGRSLDEELAVLLVHGVLHLCGYDHERGKREALRMRRRERAILGQIKPVPNLVSGVDGCGRRRR